MTSFKKFFHRQIVEIHARLLPVIRSVHIVEEIANEYELSANQGFQLIVRNHAVEFKSDVIVVHGVDAGLFHGHILMYLQKK